MSDLWRALAAQTKPVVLYGMGNGADKILSVFGVRGIEARGVFASDGFVRQGKLYRGFPVRSYAETVCSASVYIDLRVRRTAQPGDPTGPGQTMPYDFDDYDHEYFHTVPTVDSVRTNAWLEAHGVVLRTVAETNREAYSR